MNRHASRKKWLKGGMFVLALLLGGNVAHGADACFRDTGDTLVFKKFKTPKPGDCQPIHGYQHASACTLHGTACGTTNGVAVRYSFDYVCPGPGTGPSSGPYSFSIDRAGTGGVGSACDADAGGGPWGCSVFLVVRTECPATRDFR